MVKMSIETLIEQATLLAKSNESVCIALENLEEIVQQEQSSEDAHNPTGFFEYYDGSFGMMIYYAGSIIAIVGILLMIIFSFFHTYGGFFNMILHSMLGMSP